MTLSVASPSNETRTLNYTHSSATTAKVPAVINSRVLIPLNTADASAVNDYLIAGKVINAPKATGAAWAIGDKLYWDAGNSAFTKTSSGNTLCGVAGAAAASGDATGTVLFNSFFTP
jgi:predicted RecA/RadA family phage recombinase